jgi:intraflagellar transport protein 172
LTWHAPAQDHGRFAEAEAAFLAAGQPREAVEMHCHARDWAAALRVAAAHDAAAVPGVLCARGDAAAAAGDLADAEDAYIAAKAPERAIKMFREAGLWDDALRVAHALRPDAARELERGRDAAAGAAAGGGAADAKIRKAKLFERQARGLA